LPSWGELQLACMFQTPMHEASSVVGMVLLLL
jgi:hypothetical protein